MSEILTRWARTERVREVALSSVAARELVARYVAGPGLDDLVPVLRDLRGKGLLVSVEYLGKQVGRPADAADNLAAYLTLVETLVAEGLAAGAELSVRLAWLGLGLGPEHRSAPLRAGWRIGRAANNAGALMAVDMAGHDTVEATLAVWHQIHQDLPGTAITLQAGLYRTADDLPALAMPGNRVRICKGSYGESRQVSFPNPHEVDLAFVRALRALMRSQAVPLIATHDPRLVAIAEELISRAGRGPDSYEFQMMYGVRPLEQRRLADIGHPTRVHVPFGPGWYDYYVQRLAQRPANAALFARSLLEKR